MNLKQKEIKDSIDIYKKIRDETDDLICRDKWDTIIYSLELILSDLDDPLDEYYYTED